jgi:hypothetical protein
MNKIVAIGHRQLGLPTMRKLLIVTRAVAATATATAAILLPTRMSYADSVDDHYLALLSSHGITGPADQLIADGHQTCDAYSQGGFGIGISPRQVAMMKLNSDLSAQGFNPHDMSQLMLDATRAYCPQYSAPQ